jgi:hypothetical protein
VEVSFYLLDLQLHETLYLRRRKQVMGWFGTDVMGGDTPMDHLDTIGDIIKVEDLYPLSMIENKTKVAMQLARHQPKLMKNIKTFTGWDRQIATQVLAALHMAVGASFPRGLRVSAIAAAENDEWAQEDQGRSADMNDFADMVRNYDNKTPTLVNHEGLLSKMARTIGG